MAVPFSRKTKPLKKKAYHQKISLKKHHLNFKNRRDIIYVAVLKY